jgi:DNA-binding response OmpR family regulator
MKKILVIDDEKSIRKMLKIVLEKNNYKVFTAQDGNKGIQQFKDQKPDLIIIDLIMPEKEGLETIGEIKELNTSVKIIAISGGGTVDPTTYLMLAKNMGAHKTISKPIDNAALLSDVSTLLSDA